jgi:hypothetical protein
LISARASTGQRGNTARPQRPRHDRRREALAEAPDRVERARRELAQQRDPFEHRLELAQRSVDLAQRAAARR